MKSALNWPGLIRYYSKYLPVSETTPIVSLQEGATPLIHSPVLSTKVGFDVYLKYEGLNPTASFKDRGMTLAVSKAKESGARVVLCASTGNTSASAAAYASRAGLKCVVILPEGAVALGKLSQAMICDAQVIAIRGNFDDALHIAREISEESDIALVNSVNPYRIEGQKTGAFEICEQLGDAPFFHLMPVGNAGNITAYWKGYNEFKRAKMIQRLPVLLGFQAEGAAPLVHNRVISDPKTFATAIKIGNPASWQGAIQARDESKGLIDAVNDSAIRDAYQFLAVKEGVYCEPASAASVAGLLKLHHEQYFEKAKKEFGPQLSCVCVLTGHGLKDPASTIQILKEPTPVAANVQSVLKEMRL